MLDLKENEKRLIRFTELWKSLHFMLESSKNRHDFFFLTITKFQFTFFFKEHAPFSKKNFKMVYLYFLLKCFVIFSCVIESRSRDIEQRNKVVTITVNKENEVRGKEDEGAQERTLNKVSL